MKQIIMNLNSADNYLYYTNEIRQGENLSNELVIKLSPEWTGYKYLIRFKLNDNNEVVTPELIANNGEIKYIINTVLTNEAGNLKVQFEAFETVENTTRVIKSAITNLRITESLEGGTTIVPEDYVPWYTQAIEAANTATTKAQEAATSAETAGTAAAEAVAGIQGQFDAVVAGVTADSEVIIARGTEATLGNRLDKFGAQINNLDAEVITNPLAFAGKNRNINVIHDFSDVTSWTKTTTTGTTISNDDINFKTGKQGIKATVSAVTKTSFKRLKAIDVSENVYVDFYVDDETKLSKLVFSFYLAGGVKYTSYVIDSAGYIKTGWNTFPISPMSMGSRFGGITDADLISVITTEIEVFPVTGQTVNVTLDRMYTAKNNLKKAKFTFHFDDGLAGVYNVAKPILDKYGYSGITYVITDKVGTTNYMSLEQLKTLQNLGWDISSHTKTHTYFSGLTMPEIEDELSLSKKWLLNNGFYKGARHITLAGGTIQYNADILELVKKYYVTHRTMVPSLETYPPADWNNIFARVVTNTTTIDYLKSLVDKAVAKRIWLNIVFHNVKETPTTETQFSTANFQALVDYIATKDIDVVTTSDLLDYDTSNDINPLEIENRVVALEGIAVPNSAQMAYTKYFQEHIFESTSFSITLNNTNNANRRAMIELTILDQGSANGDSGGGISKYVIDVYLNASLTNSVISTTKIYGIDRIITVTVTGLVLSFSIDSIRDQIVIHARIMSLYKANETNEDNQSILY